MVWYTGVDKKIYDSGVHYRPQQKYLTTDYIWPTADEGSANVSYGIPAASVGSGTGATYTGGISNLTGDFFNTISDRQYRLNNPPNKFLGFNTMKDQELTGADLGEYIGSNTPIPQEMTTMGKVQNFLTPQSADMILNEGYDKPYGIGGPGILGFLSKMDNYHNLPVADQAFIAANMGYTGPTVFGENTTGGSKDPFGLNVRSARGNYAERVGVESEKLGESLSDRLTGKYQDMFNTDDEGLSFDLSTGMYIGTNADAVAKANQMTKMMRAKYNFYTKQNQDYADMVQQAAEIQGAKDKDIVDKLGITADDVASTTTQGGGGGIADPGYQPGSGGPPNQSSLDASKMGGGSQQAKSGGQKAGGTDRDDGGWGWADGGRVYLNLGGIASVLGTELDRREGLAPGGPAGGASAGGDYGGNVNPEQEYAGSTFEETYGGDGGGGGGEEPPTVVENKDVVDIDWLTPKPEVNINLDRSKYLAQLDLLDSLKRQELEGQIGAQIGPVDFTTMIEGGDIGNTNINYGNWSADISPNADINQISYNRNIGDWDLAANYGDGQYGIKFSKSYKKSYKHGGLASLL